MRVAVRVDGSTDVGWGHVIRCLALGETLAARGAAVEFVTRELPRELAGRIASRGIAARVLEASSPAQPVDWQADAAATGAAIGAAGGRPDWLIVDHYGLDDRWETAVSGYADRILAIDDLEARRHACSVLLDQTPGRNAAEYAGLTSKRCRLLLGPKWALLRSQFAASREAALERWASAQQVKRILVNLGGTDSRGLLQAVVRGIAGSGVKAAVDVMIGADRPEIANLVREWVGEGLEISVLANVENVARVMARADMAIGAAGTSSWERCALGLPTLLIVVADNQRANARFLDSCGAARYLCDWHEATPERIGDGVSKFAQDAELLASVSAAASRVCDGRGVDRAHVVLVGATRTKDGGEVSLRLAGPEDEQITYQWQSHPATRRHARNPAVPSRDEHHDWFRRALANPDVLMMIIERSGKPAGVLRLDPPRTDEEHEVSILVAPESARQGVAAAALRLADRLAPGWTLRAEVLLGNEASLRLFMRAGYERVAPTTFVRGKPQRAKI